MSKLDDKLDEYVKKFNDSFPIMMMLGASDDKIIDLIDKAIKENKPYEITDDDPSVIF